MEKENKMGIGIGQWVMQSWIFYFVGRTFKPKRSKNRSRKSNRRISSRNKALEGAEAEAKVGAGAGSSVGTRQKLEQEQDRSRSRIMSTNTNS